jgi:hypothetical protein
VIEVCGQRVMCRYRASSRSPAAVGRPVHLGCAAGGRHRPTLSAWEGLGRLHREQDLR